MTVCAMSILAGLLASGCQKGSSFEQFAKQIEGAKSIRMEAVFKEGAGTRPVTTLRKLPFKAKTISNEVIAMVNETDGWLEIDTAQKKYHPAPWSENFVPLLGKLVPSALASCYPAYGISPLRIAPAKDWKLSKNGGADVWKTEVISQLGIQKFEFELSSDGSLKRYAGPSGEFVVSNWELNPSIDDKEFTTQIPDGYVMHSLPVETMDLIYGKKIEFGSFVSNHKNKPGPGWTFVVFTDPADSISAAMKGWLTKTNMVAAKIEVSLGSGGDYSIPNASLFWKLVSATPTACLINKNGEIRAMWQGFDLAEASRLEKEIAQAIKENS